MQRYNASAYNANPNAIPQRYYHLINRKSKIMHSRLTPGIPQTTVTLHYKSLKVKVQLEVICLIKDYYHWAVTKNSTDTIYHGL